MLERALPDAEAHERWSEFETLVPHVEAALEHLDGPEAVSGRLLNHVGIYLTEVARPGEARGVLERALTINEAVYGPDHPDVAITLTNLGNVRQGVGGPGCGS